MNHYRFTAEEFKELCRLGLVTPAGWSTPKAGDARESGATGKQQAEWASLSREAQKALRPGEL